MAAAETVVAFCDKAALSTDVLQRDLVPPLKGMVNDNSQHVRAALAAAALQIAPRAGGTGDNAAMLDVITTLLKDRVRFRVAALRLSCAVSAAAPVSLHCRGRCCRVLRVAVYALPLFPSFVLASVQCRGCASLCALHKHLFDKMRPLLSEVTKMLPGTWLGPPTRSTHRLACYSAWHLPSQRRCGAGTGRAAQCHNEPTARARRAGRGAAQGERAARPR